jgi:release factor glutamine methyltransferase
MELLLCHVLGCSRAWLYGHDDTALPALAARQLQRLLRRCLHREPLQYVLGEVDFCGLRLRVRPGVFIPRPETELLVEEAVRILRQLPVPNPAVLDLGTGSGAIAVAIAAHHPGARVLGVDISARALRCARSNARALGIRRVRFRPLDILRQLPQGRFHMVVSNPPYIPAARLPQLQPEVREYEPAEALTDFADGLSFYRRYAHILPQVLLPGGVFLLELGDGLASAAVDILRSTGARLSVRRDYAGTERILIGWMPDSPR